MIIQSIEINMEEYVPIHKADQKRIYNDIIEK